MRRLNTEAERESARLETWRRSLFPALRSARRDLDSAEAAHAAAEAELGEADEALREHEYHRLLAAKAAARERLAQAEARRSRALDSVRRAGEARPTGAAGSKFDREYAEWEREQGG